MCFIEDSSGASHDSASACAGWADRRRPLKQETVDRVLRLCDALPRGDRELLEATYRDGKTAVALARLLEKDPRGLRRRIARLTARVLSPQYRFVLSHRDSWAPARRRVASEIFINGKSARAAAAALRISLHTARRHQEAVLAMHEAVEAARKALSGAKAVGS